MGRVEVKIPLVDLTRQYSLIREEIDEAIREVISSAAFVGGGKLDEFEEQFAKFCGARFAIGVGSGTAALHLALVVAGVGKGDEVITVPNTFIATTEAITAAGANITFVDIDPATFNMNASAIERVITAKTRAIVPVHLYGQPCDMDPILEVARKHNLIVIEDACQAHGAKYKNRNVGAFGEAGCFSFYPSKNLGAWGDGGCVVTNEENIARRLLLLRDHGRKDRYTHEVEGTNSRLDAIQAAILTVKLRHLEEWNRLRRSNANLYRECLAGVEGILPPQEADHSLHVYHLYVIRTKRRDYLAQALREAGIHTGIHYPIPLHLQPAYKHLKMENGSFPATEQCAKEILSLPMFPELKEDEIIQCCNTIRETMSNKA